MTDEVVKVKKERKVLTPEDKEFNKNKLFFTFGGIGRDMLYCLIANYFFTYVQFGLTLTVAQFTTLSLLIGIVGRIWDGINDPMMGAIVDGVHLKWGKFKPWIFYGAIANCLLMVALFNVRPFGTSEAQGWIYVGLICFIYLIWEACFTANDIGYWSMIPSLSRTREKRDSLTSATIFWSGIGSAGMSLLISYLSPGNVLNAYTMFSIIACVAAIGTQTVTVLGTKEAPRDDTEKTGNDVSLKKMFTTIIKNKQVLWISLGMLLWNVGNGIFSGLMYNLYYLEVGYNGNLVFVATILGAFNMVLQLLYPQVSKKLTRKQIQKIAFIMMAIGYSILIFIGWTSFLPLNLITLGVVYFPIAVGGTYFYISSVINMSNCVEYNEYTTGERDEAVISTMRPLIVKFSDAIKSLIVTLVLITSGLYAISQNVANLESQTSLFSKKVTTVEDQIHYVSKLNSYGLRLENEAELSGEDSDAYKALVAEIDNEIASDSNETMELSQVKASYINVYREMYLMKRNSNNKLVSAIKIKDLTVPQNFIENGYTYSVSFKFDETDLSGINYNVNVADDIYKAKASTKTRLILRIAVTIVPIIIIFFSLFIQTKPFKIDEDYYDMMLEEIKKRKEAKTKEVKMEEANNV